MYFALHGPISGLGDADPCEVNPSDPVCQAFWGPTGQAPAGSNATRPIDMGPGTLPTAVPPGAAAAAAAMSPAASLNTVTSWWPGLLALSGIIGVGLILHHMFHGKGPSR